MGLRIIADSSCDLSKELTRLYNIDIAPFYISYGDDVYRKDYYELTKDEFYQTLIDRECYPKTSMPTFEDYYTAFSEFAENGDDIICITLTSKFSGSYNCACMAKEQLKEKYENVNIEIIDSETTCLMQGYLVIEARKLHEQGLSLSKIAKRINTIKKNCGAVITVDSLVYLQRGGRIGKVSSIAGDFLNIKPIILVTDGELIPHSKVRTRKKAKDRIIELALEKTAAFNKDNITYFAVHTAAYDEAITLRDQFADRSGSDINTNPSTLSCTIGAHIGPSVVGIGFFVNEGLDC